MKSSMTRAPAMGRKVRMVSIIVNITTMTAVTMTNSPMKMPSM